MKVLENLDLTFPGVYTEKNVLLSATHTHSVPAGFMQYFTFNITNLGFIGVAAGNVFPTSPEAPNVTELLGYYLPGVDDVGDDILQAMGNGGGSQGFTGPLGAGSYTFWAQETGPSTDNWDLNFVVSEVPAPGALALLGLAGIAARRRRA